MRERERLFFKRKSGIDFAVKGKERKEGGKKIDIKKKMERCSEAKRAGYL